jgi:dienelactone hydrolase
MKLPRGLLALASLVLLMGALSSCALHPCGKMDGRQNPRDFAFRNFKGKDHLYPVAITKPAGAPMLVMHGLGGLDGATLDWAKLLSQQGWKVYMPMLAGEFDRCDPLAHTIQMRLSGIWKTNDLHTSGQVLDDMGVLADRISALHGGKQVVAVGHCLTGAFPLALLSRASVRTAVLCQPALPAKSPLEIVLGLPQTPEKQKALAIPPPQLKKSLLALHDPSKRVYGFHYLEDPLASMEKFYSLQEELKRRGLAGKFRPVVLVPAGSRIHESWWEERTTRQPKTRIQPHVTVTGAEEVDRTPLRKRFNEMIRP